MPFNSEEMQGVQAQADARKRPAEPCYTHGTTTAGGALVDPVNHPAHYTAHPSGVECIQITEHFNFNRGNAIKYIWRAGSKSNEVQDLEKARFYIDRELQRLKNSA